MMNHYPHFTQRPVHVLDGLWEAAFLGEVDPDVVVPEEISWTDRMAVPGVFDACPDYFKKRGCFALRCAVKTVQPGRRGKLQVGGLGLWAKVFVDGEARGICRTPYAPWSVAIPASDQSIREVVFLIDNRFHEERVPLFDPFFDFYAYGGIYRSLSWHELPDLALGRVVVTPLDLKGRVSVEVRLDGPAPEALTIGLAFDGGELVRRESCPVENGVIAFETEVPNARRWSPESPHLHVLRVEIEEDTIVERFGLRTVRTSGKQILLNDEPIKLLGYNRHEAHPQFGPALPDQQLLQDLQLLRQMGCNFVRGSHYPQDQRFLDLCDELGFLVWEEGLGWGTPVRHLTNPLFNELQEVQTRAMIRVSINHPSILLWGFLNECESHTPESEAPIAHLAAVIREEDPSRLVTFASNHPFEERNYGKIDVISINQYPGWYAEDRFAERPLGEIERLIDRLLVHFEEQGQGDKPFIISEMGAGAIYGWRDPLEAHWSEQYQAAYLDILTRRVVEDERICGLAIWQFCDGRTYSNSCALGRPRSFNNKGSFDEYRRPKMAVEAVRKRFRKDLG